MSDPLRHQPLSYRPDIDGLRAVAVTAVILFHLGVPGTFGGFIGVDVFFVISGYLITGLLVREIEAGTFSLASFYRRRILRIFPALFTVMFVVSLIAWKNMLPGELMSHAKAVLSTTFFCSNVLFYSETSYFAQSAHLKPLLHTWSLAIEEQFYLLWPLVISTCLSRGKTRLQSVGGMLACGSFAMAVVWVRQDVSAAFYLLPTRAWEFLVGGAIAIHSFERLVRVRWMRETAAGLGLAMIVVCVKIYNGGTLFPGESALLPCVGAGLVVAAGKSGPTVAGRLLSLRPCVHIGKLAYSLYLWHWPVIVFSRTILFREATPSTMLAALLLVFVLSSLTWRFIESPSRGGPGTLSWKMAIPGAVALSIVLGTAAVAILFLKGAPNRLSGSALRMATLENYDGDAHYRRGSCFVVEKHDAFNPKVCLTRSRIAPNVLLLGDSHAAHLWPGLARLEPAAHVLQATHAGCRPMLRDDGGENRCEEFVRWIVRDWLPNNRVDAVVLSGRWQTFDLPSLRRTLAALSAANQRVILVGPIPQYVAPLPNILASVYADATADATAIVGRARLAGPLAAELAMRNMPLDRGITYFSLYDTVCPSDRCTTLGRNGLPIQFDYGHLTTDGSEEIVAPLTALLQQRTFAARGTRAE